MISRYTCVGRSVSSLVHMIFTYIHGQPRSQPSYRLVGTKTSWKLLGCPGFSSCISYCWPANSPYCIGLIALSLILRLWFIVLLVYIRRPAGTNETGRMAGSNNAALLSSQARMTRGAHCWISCVHTWIWMGRRQIQPMSPRSWRASFTSVNRWQSVDLNLTICYPQMASGTPYW